MSQSGRSCPPLAVASLLLEHRPTGLLRQTAGPAGAGTRRTWGRLPRAACGLACVRACVCVCVCVCPCCSVSEVHVSCPLREGALASSALRGPCARLNGWAGPCFGEGPVSCAAAFTGRTKRRETQGRSVKFVLRRSSLCCALCAAPVPSAVVLSRWLCSWPSGGFCAVFQFAGDRDHHRSFV